MAEDAWFEEIIDEAIEELARGLAGTTLPPDFQDVIRDLYENADAHIQDILARTDPAPRAPIIDSEHRSPPPDLIVVKDLHPG